VFYERNEQEKKARFYLTQKLYDFQTYVCIYIYMQIKIFLIFFQHHHFALISTLIFSGKGNHIKKFYEY
jgi:hypothetical protein